MRATLLFIILKCCGCLAISWHWLWLIAPLELNSIVWRVLLDKKKGGRA